VLVSSDVVGVAVVVGVDVLEDVVVLVVLADVALEVSLSLPPGLGPQATSKPSSENNERRAGPMCVSSKLDPILRVERAPPHPSSDRS